MGKRNYLED